MKKFLKVLLIIILVVTIVLGFFVVYKNAGWHNEYIDNYVTNFKDNLMNIRLKYELKKSERNEQNEEIEQSDEISETPIPTESPKIIETDSEKDNEYINPNTDFLPKEFVSSGDPVSINSASLAKFHRYQGGLLCVTENSINLFSNKGEKKWSTPIQISNPVLRVKGSYILLFEQGGRKFLVYKNKNFVFEAQAKNNILMGNISSSGDTIFATDKEYYKGAVSVYNNSGEEIYQRNFGNESVISADISDSRKIAVSLMNVTNQVVSTVVYFDVFDEEEKERVSYENTIIYDLDFVGNTLFAYADDKLIALNERGKQEWIHNFDGKNLKHYQKDKSDVSVLLFDNNNNSEFSVINSSGKEKQKIKTEIIPDFCDICDGYIIYNNGRNLFLTKINGEYLAKYTSSRDIHMAYFIDSQNVVVVYNRSIEFLHTVKNKKEQEE